MLPLGLHAAVIVFITWSRRNPLALGLLWIVLALVPLRLSATTSSLGSVAEIRAWQPWAPLAQHPIRVEGIVTLIDPVRNLVVLQDKTGALAFELGDAKLELQSGQQVVLEAADSWPYTNNLAYYPDRPNRREVLPDFTWAQPLEGGFFISRFRCLLHPPATGLYRLYISSDDSSRLLLGSDASATSRRQIASVPSYTRPHYWSRTPSQGSEEVFLESGRAYYLEAVHHQAGGPSHLAVAWEGPGVPFSVIEGKYLSAWPQDLQGLPGDSSLTLASKAGVLREIWNDVPIVTIDEMLAPRRLESILSVRGVVVKVLGSGVLPEPVQLKIGQKMPEELNYSWSEIEGTVEFVGVNGDRVSLELSEAGESIEVIASHWAQSEPSALRGRRIRVIGVAESLWSRDNHDSARRLWMRSSDSVVVTPHAPPSDVARLTTITELLNEDQKVLRDTAIKLKGRVVSQKGNRVTISDDGVFVGSISSDGETWIPVGTPLENEMPSLVYVGFAVSSRQPNAKSRAEFSRTQGLVGPLRLLDIGSPALVGEVQKLGDKYLIDGVGTDIWDAPDQFTFVYKAVEGPCSIVTRLDSFDPASSSVKAGLMIRERLAADGPFIDLVSTFDGSKPVLSLQWRWERQGSSTRQANDYSLKPGAPVWFKLERRYSSVEVIANETFPFGTGERVNIVGYASIRDGKPVVVGASLIRPPRETMFTWDQSNWRPLVDLTQVNDGTSRWGGFDIFRLRGVVTFCGDVLGRHYWTFQDRSGAALLTPRERSGLFAVKSGQMVEVVGYPGWHPASSVLYADNVFTLGPAALPTPIRHPAEYLHPRRGEGTWIELDGIVRSVLPGGLLLVKSRAETFTVAIADCQEASLDSFIDAEVRLRGAIVYPSESERLLLVPSLSLVELLVAARSDAFTGPIEELGSFNAEGLLSQSRHRVLVSGVVTYADQGLVYIQDGSGAARLETNASGGIEVGSTLLVSGFPDWGPDECLVLRNAKTRPSAEGPTAVPFPLSEEALSTGAQLNRLVQIRASVVKTWGTGEDDILTLESSQRIFQASFPRGGSPTRTLPAGSAVELTGIIARDVVGPVSPRAASLAVVSPLRILARGASDLVVLQTPSWWVLRRTLIIASLVALAALVSVVWIQLLRKRVRQRTEELSATMESLQEEAARSATLAERDRLAGEIHDSLEQGLNGIIFHLECTTNLSACPDEIRDALRLACNMASFSRTEVQYAVWELQSPMLEDSDLLTAVEKISQQIAPDSLVASVRVEGVPRRLSSVVEHHLLRVVQEALNNIVKHAKASHAEVVLSYGPVAVELCICDDGCGFAPDTIRTGGLGHFGLRSLRSRVAKIQGVLEVKSEPGKGTTVRAKVPLSNN